MSCFAGLCESPEAKEAKAKNAAINKDIRKYKKKFENELRLLLLGAGESGKSTIVKQMRIIHSTGFSVKEREQMRKPIYGNVVNSIKAILEFMDTAKIDLADPSLKEVWLIFPVAVFFGGDALCMHLLQFEVTTPV